MRPPRSKLPDLKKSLSDPTPDAVLAEMRRATRAEPPKPEPAAPEPVLRMGSAIHWAVGVLLVAEILLLALDYALTRGDITYTLDTRLLFALGEEVSVPTWFNATQTGFVGAVALGILFARRFQGARRREVVAWAILAAFFLFMAADDAARIHERVGSAIGDVAIGNGIIDGGGLRSYYWITFLGPIFVALGIFMVAFLWRAFGRYRLRRYLLLGPGLYAAAIGLDFAEGLGGVHEWIAERYDVALRDVEHYFIATEEYIEMVGSTVILFAFLMYLAHATHGLRVTLSLDGDEDGDEVSAAPSEAMVSAAVPDAR
jgi:hypothetical protein